jgi:hypothetical protein
MIKTSCVVWDKDAVDITADQAVRAASGRGDDGEADRGKQGEAQQFLKDMLSSGEPVGAKELYAEAEKLKFSERQIKRAKLHLNKRGMHIDVYQSEGRWVWQNLPFNG